MTYVTIDTVTMPIEAARSVEWAGVDVAEDLRALRAGETTYEQLLEECLDGAEPEHEGDWRDYVAAVCAAAEQDEVAQSWDFEGFWNMVIGRTPSRCVAEYGLTGDRAAVSAWVDEAAVQAWQAGGQGGRMPEEWVEFVERAADVLAAEVAEQAPACESGTATGEPCTWTGDADDLVPVEWMPEHLRSSHEAAGNWGVYPYNGAERIRCCPACAEMLQDEQAEQAEVAS